MTNGKTHLYDQRLSEFTRKMIDHARLSDTRLADKEYRFTHGNTGADAFHETKRDSGQCEGTAFLT